MGPGSNAFQRSISAYPLLALLSHQHPGTDTGGVQVAKALVLGAMFQGSLLATADAVRECADGLRKTLTKGDWRALMHWDSLEYGNDLGRTLVDAEKLLDAAAGRALQGHSEVHSSFVRSLREVLAGLRAGGARMLRTPTVDDGADTEEDEAARPSRPVQVRYPDAPEDSPRWDERRDPEAAHRPTTAGEAREGEPTALPDRRSAELGGETDEHAEFRALHTGFHAAITNQYLPVDHDQLLDHELKALARALKAALGAKEGIARRAAALLITSLFTGEALASILDSRVEPTVRPGFRATGRWVRIVRTEPDARVARPAIRKHLARHGDRFELAMPVEAEHYFEEALRHTLPGTQLSDALGGAPQTIIRQAKNWLREFRKKHPRVLVGKVSRWLQTALYARSHDHVAVHLLTAVETDPVCPAAYYCAPRAADLQASHRRLVASVWTGEVALPSRPNVRVGSWWYPADGELRRLYDVAREALLARAEDESLPLWRRHRAHQVMSALNIILGTAMRRVSDPGESLDMFDLNRALGVLDDKSGGPARGHRVVPLTTAVVEQFKQQSSYLHRLVAMLWKENPHSATAIEVMRARPEMRIAPFFFLLNEGYEIRSLQPSDIEDELGDLWPFPLNFARHWLSTALRERGVDDATICSLLGHALLGTQNLSPVGLQAVEAHYAAMRPKLHGVLRDAGVRPVPPLVLAAPASTPASVPVRLDEVAPLFEFGSARRARERAQQEEAVQQDLKAFLAKHVPDGNLKGLNRKQVDGMFTALGDLTPNATSYRAYRLRVALRNHLAAAAKRYQKDWLLPSVEVGLADFQISIDADAFTAARRVQALRQALSAALGGPDAGQGGAPAVASDTPVGVLALALAAECLVLDYVVLRSWISQPSLTVVGIRASSTTPSAPQLWLRVTAEGVGTRMHPIQPWLVRAAAARADSGWGLNDLRSVDREIARFANEHGLAWLRGGLKIALQTIRAAASLSLSGMSLSFADGTHGGVSLPQSTLDRLVRGAVSPATLEAIGQASTARTEVLDIHVIADDQTIAHPSVSKDLLGVNAFMDMVGLCFEDAAKFTTTKAAAMAFGKTRVEFLEALVKEKFAELQETTATPPICGHLAGWLAAMCIKGARLKGKKEGRYSFKSLKTYWSNVARRLVEQVDVENIAQMDAVEIEEIYRDVLEFADTDRLDHIYAALRVFHAHLIRRHGVPSLEWGPLAAMADSGPGRVDANLVLESEYLDALRLLKTDPKADPRQRLLQAAVLVLCFRCGLRIGEAIGLRRKDIDYIGGVWIVAAVRGPCPRLAPAGTSSVARAGPAEVVSGDGGRRSDRRPQDRGPSARHDPASGRTARCPSADVARRQAWTNRRHLAGRSPSAWPSRRRRTLPCSQTAARA